VVGGSVRLRMVFIPLLSAHVPIPFIRNKLAIYISISLLTFLSPCHVISTTFWTEHLRVCNDGPITKGMYSAALHPVCSGVILQETPRESAATGLASLDLATGLSRSPTLRRRAVARRLQEATPARSRTPHSPAKT
jgi:hypothetical protein